MIAAAAIGDWRALCEAKARYCRTMDAKDWAAFGELLADDFELDVSATADIPVTRGRETVVEQLRAGLANVAIAHQVHSPEMEISGDEARVIWAMQERVVYGPARPPVSAYGHYHERWIRQGGSWKLAALRLTRQIVEAGPPAPG